MHYEPAIIDKIEGMTLNTKRFDTKEYEDKMEIHDLGLYHKGHLQAI